MNTTDNLEKHQLQQLIEDLHKRQESNHDGDVASYIPELLKADPAHFGVALVTNKGQIFETGNTNQEFSIQSISKPMTYGLALEIYGQDKVLKYVGIEPSGDAFNSIMLEDNTNRPFNPMVNAGAITVTALLYEHYGNEAFDIILNHFSDAAGRELKFDEEVYKSESKTGHRNRAIAHLLLNFGMVHENIEPALDLYFKQCAILVNTRDLAMMAATIANVGENPVTSKEVFGMNSVRNIMSIMFTCGMYDFSGEWAYKVGVPAKSGVSGGLMAVVNRQMGIATYSPRLDKHGNSVRGINACIELSNELGLHAFDYLNNGSSFLNIIIKK